MIRADGHCIQMITGDNFTDVAPVNKLDRRYIENLVKFPYERVVIRSFTLIAAV